MAAERPIDGAPMWIYVIGCRTKFLDRNVLVYAFTANPRAEQAQRLLARGCNIGVQGLNEFANVARRKQRMTSWTKRCGRALAAIRTLCRSILPIDIDTYTDTLTTVAIP
jgi:predicted nucleic acid-binding protein